MLKIPLITARLAVISTKQVAKPKLVMVTQFGATITEASIGRKAMVPDWRNAAFLYASNPLTAHSSPNQTPALTDSPSTVGARLYTQAEVIPASTTKLPT